MASIPPNFELTFVSEAWQLGRARDQAYYLPQRRVCLGKVLPKAMLRQLIF